MSGGSWDYVYGTIGDVCDALENDTTTRYRSPQQDLTEEQRSARRRLAAHLRLVSSAMHAIEWVDSGDTSTPSDVDAIARVFADVEVRR